MLAVHLENGQVEVRRRARPRRPDKYALLRLLCGGICNTDLELLRGYYNFRGTPGHEFVAEVVEADTPGLVGNRVVGEINLSCGRCEWCQVRKVGRHCKHRTVLGIVNCPGAFSDFFVLPEENLHTVPDQVATEDAVFTEPLAAACEILDQVSLPRAAPVAVLGDGKLGLLIAQVLHVKGCAVHVFGRHRGKLRIAEAAGICARLYPRQPASAEYELVVDATGSPDGLHRAVQMVQPRGTVVLKSTVHEKVSIDTAPIVVNELTLIGSRCGRFEPALELIRLGKIRLAGLISDRFPLSEAPRAFARAQQKGVLKVLFTPK